MVDSPNYRLGYTFANALNAVSELHNLTRIEEAIVAKHMAQVMSLLPHKFSIFRAEDVLEVPGIIDRD